MTIFQPHAHALYTLIQTVYINFDPFVLLSEILFLQISIYLTWVKARVTALARLFLYLINLTPTGGRL